MKKAVLSSVLTTLCFLALAQVPEFFNYQVVVRDGSSNNPLVNQNVSFRMSILKGSISGESQYSELHSANTGALGLVNLVIGNGTGKIGSISSIDWGGDSYFLKVELDKGDAIFVDMGTTQLLSVPYAMHAKTTETFSETDPVFETFGVKTTGNQTIEGNKTFTGTTTVPAPVNVTDAATKEYVDNTLKAINLIFVPGAYAGIINDIDGNMYATYIIGTQTWMAQNLKTTRYKDGTAIPLVIDNTEWSNLTTPGYCWYDNNEVYKNTCGALYNWFTVNTSNLCPTGWHVPTNTEWTTLEIYLITNGYNFDGTTTYNKIAKSLASIILWEPFSGTGATGNTDYPAKRNATGFSALPGGMRYNNGPFEFIGLRGNWWSATSDPDYAGSYVLQYDWMDTLLDITYKSCGLSVRCLKD